MSRLGKPFVLRSNSQMRTSDLLLAWTLLVIRDTPALPLSSYHQYFPRIPSECLRLSLIKTLCRGRIIRFWSWIYLMSRVGPSASFGRRCGALRIISRLPTWVSLSSLRRLVRTGCFAVLLEHGIAWRIGWGKLGVIGA